MGLGLITAARAMMLWEAGCPLGWDVCNGVSRTSTSVASLTGVSFSIMLGLGWMWACNDDDDHDKDAYSAKPMGEWLANSVGATVLGEDG